MLTQTERINLVILTLKQSFGLITGGNALIADGVVGQKARDAAAELREDMWGGNLDENEINLLILTLKAAGFNDDLNADGVAGPQLDKALDAVLALGEEDGAGEQVQAAAAEAPAAGEQATSHQ